MTVSSNAPSFPASVDLHRWADAGFTWTGSVPYARFTRLYPQLEQPEGSLQVSCSLETRDRLLWLSGTVAGAVALTCQRCLKPVTVPVAMTVSLALLDNEDQIGPLGEDSDYVLRAEAEQLHATEVGYLDLLALLEDDLLLTLPLSPRHDTCAAAQFAQEELPETDDAKANPFAVLAGLKT